MHSTENLKHLTDIAKATQPATDAFWLYDKAALAGGEIPKKYKELMAVAVALTTQCAYCIEIHGKAARDAGASDAELAEVVHVAAALRAGAAMTHGTHLFR